MIRSFQTCLLLLTLLFCLPPQARAISDNDLEGPEYLNLSLGTGFEYTTGGYGTDSTINTIRVPLIIGWAPHERFSLSVEIPYLRQSSTGETVLIGDRMHGGGHGGSGSTLIRSTNSEQGLGDVTLDAAFTLFQESDQTPKLSALFYTKLPTADEQKGLGTGELDWGSGLGLGKKFGQWSAYAEALFIQPGSSTTYDPDNYWDWLVSLHYRANPGLQPGISLSGGTAPFDGADTPLEIKGKLSGITGDHTSYSCYISRGLSDASPDWSVGIFGYLDF